jgi:AraC family transcriptional regulator, regulatory protein of adaptative response / methylphosphotriester-DNA alkyltransferase methyltransferase
LRRASTIRHRTALFEEAAGIIESDYQVDLELADVARAIATSRRQLQRAFQEVGATTFRGYVAEVRMRKAGELLASEPDMTVRAIARDVGYSQPAQFAKAFRRHCGMSPAEFRAHAASRPPPSRARFSAEVGAAG